MSKKRQRPQAQKSRNKALYDAMVEIRRSNATAPIPSGKQYKRPKAGSRGRDW